MSLAGWIARLQDVWIAVVLPRLSFGNFVAFLALDFNTPVS
jgi:hypothetical protein